MKKNPKITHILANGTVVESIAGKVIPRDNPVYELVLRKGAKKK